jgi:hypothetical protein
MGQQMQEAQVHCRCGRWLQGRVSMEYLKAKEEKLWKLKYFTIAKVI